MKKRALACLLMVCLLFGLLSGTSLAAGERYVGFRTGGAFTTKGEYSGAGVAKLYVMKETEYDALKSSGGTPSENNAEVAYCFNLQAAYPKKWTDYTVYEKLANVSHDEFVAEADDVRDTANLDKWLISIGLNGYPLDYSGFNKDKDGNNIISDDAFRVLTQKAIWYYTDSYDWLEYESYQATEAEKIIYNQLISTRLPDDVIQAAQAVLDMYLWDKDSSPYTSGGIYKSYQHLLAINTAGTPQQRVLTLCKTVEDGSADDVFTFKLKVMPGTGNVKDYWINDMTAAEVDDDGAGNITVKMKADESVSIHVFGSSFSYSIEEVKGTYASGYAYAPSISVASGMGTIDASTERKVSGENVTQATNIVYTNTKTDVPDDPDDPDDDPADPDDPDDPDDPVQVDPGDVIVKKIVAGKTDHTEKFDFEVQLQNDDGSAYSGTLNETDGKYYVNCIRTAASGHGVEGKLEVNSQGVAAFKLGDGEQMKLELPAGVKYQIDETNIPRDFIMTYDESVGLHGTVEADKTVTHTVTNTYDNSTNELVIKKELDGGDSQVEFTFDVNITGYTGHIYVTGTDIVAGTMVNGVGTITMKAGQSVTMKGIADGVKFSIHEKNIPEGYEFESVSATLQRGPNMAATELTDMSAETGRMTSAFENGVRDNVITVTFTNSEAAEPEDETVTPSPTPTPNPKDPQNPEPEQDEPQPVTPAEPDEPGEPDQPEAPEEPENASQTVPEEDAKDEQNESLPQTGMDWWTIAMLSGAGTALLASGVIVDKRRRPRRHR